MAKVMFIVHARLQNGLLINATSSHVIDRTKRRFHLKNELFQEIIATFWGYCGYLMPKDKY